MEEATGSLSPGIMVRYQLSTGKQYSGDSYFREQDFIQKNPHGTLAWILMPVLCYPSQPGTHSSLPQASLTVGHLLS
jgi:hypothetical protein